MSLKGKVLVAPPSTDDSIFDRSVILICEHDANGAMGLIVNKVSPVSLKQISGYFPWVQNHDQNFILGGPVSQDELWVLHTCQTNDPNNIEIRDGVYLCSNPGFMNEYSELEREQFKIRFMLGYAGWSPGQLDDEIDRDGWIVRNFDDRLIFANDFTKSWSRALHDLGGEYAWISYSPRNADCN